ncbi:hypothetical protein RRX38_05535 [Pseudomonas sp. DTU_2021_1001937_2_SI_NGA_ILE_001]|uniref:hypothetical protein n=1 Tax=Pseudomonas sp. DTU_2021_1001937_2_SI_NGA_ILE_001 TaxID=3077589 RepID=UPI0028FC156D|nr:hypothetical protein [Pseudomonas sp. DTU_2021_1001937_2_SI_NGA_ILE_001]WNW10638.1 hypothetical protein RRX38_05535 [Pseudomonas sp. DTU_2021_1001937_2_SI_NGA_ILE_001]
MSLSIGLPAPVVNVGTVASSGGASAVSGEQERESPLLTPVQQTSASGGKKGSGLGKAVDTLVDRLADLHEQLRRLRQELKAALSSPQPDIVRLPRILSLQRQIMVTNSDIQLVSGLLVSTLSRMTLPGVRATA